MRYALRALARSAAPSISRRKCFGAPSLADGSGFTSAEVLLLGRFIVDMLAPSIRLVVEVDGRCHERKRQSDKRRDKLLAQAGYRVLRLQADLVLRNLPAAVAQVVDALAQGQHRV